MSTTNGSNKGIFYTACTNFKHSTVLKQLTLIVSWVGVGEDLSRATAHLRFLVQNPRIGLREKNDK